MKKSRKLTDADVLKIRHAAHYGVPGKELAKLFGVSAATISQIKHGHVHQKVKAPPAECSCTIEMATFRDTGSKCAHCGGVVVKGGSL